jgi:lipid II isoglutaminyl synthase (glutamine-hydrolysing)
MKIELLFAKVANLYGDQGNVMLLKKVLSKAYFYETDLNETPKFVESKVDLIVLGSMSEKMQLKVIERLLPHRNKLQQLIDDGVSFLVTGNALDIFGEWIESETGIKHPALNLFKFRSVENKKQRHNSIFLGKYKGVSFVGFKTQFTQLYPTGNLPSLCSVERGTGHHVGAKEEGVFKNRFYGTNCVGPVLVMNPLFTLDLLKGMGLAHPSLPFQELMMRTYHLRVSEFRDPKIINHP